MPVSTWIPMTNNGAAPFVPYGPNKIFCPTISYWSPPGGSPNNTLVLSDALIPIYPLPGSAGGIGSWAF